MVMLIYVHGCVYFNVCNVALVRLWPWSYDKCDRKAQKQQKVNGCMPQPHFGMNGHQGRGAPEIDILEVQPGNVKGNTKQFLKTKIGQPFIATSLQVTYVMGLYCT